MQDRMRRVVVFLSATLLPFAANANAGVPMLALAWPAHWLALLPIIAIESLLLASRLGLQPSNTLWPVAKANLLSTFVGVPLAWAGMLLLEFIVLGGLLSLLPESVAESNLLRYLLFPFAAAWVGGKPWEIYGAFLVLAIPFCAISIYIEHRYLRRLFASQAEAVRGTVRIGNVLTYVLMCVAALLFPLLAHSNGT